MAERNMRYPCIQMVKVLLNRYQTYVIGISVVDVETFTIDAFLNGGIVLVVNKKKKKIIWDRYEYVGE